MLFRSDVETYELVGESVMEALLKAGSVQLHDDQRIQQFIVSTSNEIEGWKNLWLSLLVRKNFSL